MKYLHQAEEEDFKNNCIATGIITGSFLFSMTWWFFLNSDITINHPLVYREDGSIGVLTYSISQYITFLSEIVNVLALLIAKDFAPKMKFGKFGDMWYYLYVFYACNIIDFVLTYRTSPYRHWFIMAFLIMQLLYLVDKYRNIYK